VSAYLGIDIGTFEAKGVLTRADGSIIAQASRPHRMQVPRPGWAEHDAEADWWGGFTELSRACWPRAASRPATSAPSPAALSVPACFRWTPQARR
jgi:xylulokinase